MADLTKEELRKLLVANNIKNIDLKQTKPKIISAVRKQGYTVDVKKKTIQRSRGGKKPLVRKKRPPVKAEVIVKTRRVVKTPPRKQVKKAPVVKQDPPKKDPPKKDPPKKDPPKKDPPKKGGKG